jgi:hypothetical protein
MREADVRNAGEFVNQEPLPWDDAGNVLLAALPEEMSFNEWADRLRYIPSFEKAGLTESSLHLIDQLVAPTGRMVSMALALHSAMIHSYRKRDPRKMANVKELMLLGRIIQGSPIVDLDNLPGREAAGGIVQGPTGSGKSHSLDAVLRQFIQVHDHTVNEEAGWLFCQQVVYLKAYMPADNSRKGLYASILYELDAVLGTNYMREMPRMFTLDQQLLYVIQKLIAHSCGVLVIEETQERNLAGEVLSSEFANVFLAILNRGIPLFLVGNPNAFSKIMRFSQDRRRFTDAGRHDFYPAYDEQDEDWRDGLVPEVWSWLSLGEPDEQIEGLPALLHERTGGIPGLLSRYRRECLVLAMRHGYQHVTRDIMDEAYFSNAMEPMHSLIAAYREKNLEALYEEASDAPIEFLSQVWAREKLRRSLAGKRLEG